MDEREIYWKAADQQERLAELTATGSERTTLPLRRDVRSLGLLLGEVIREQAGQGIYEAEEELRHLSIRLRQLDDGQGEASIDLPGQEELRDRALAIVRRLSIDDSLHIVKAFGIYFELTNLAETNHLKRRLRAVRLAAGVLELNDVHLVAEALAKQLDRIGRRAVPMRRVDADDAGHA